MLTKLNCWELWQSQGRKHDSNILFHQFTQLWQIIKSNKSRPSATTINNDREMTDNQNSPSATAIDEERERKISDHMVGHKILHASPRIRSLHTSM